MGRRSGIKAVALAVLACGALLIGAQGASADLKFCPPGSGAGQCASPQGLATDFETDRLYVAETGNNRVSVFKASTAEFLFAFGWGVDTGAEALETCTTASTCQAGKAGDNAGQLSAPRRIAVDNVAGSAARHDIYVISGLRVNRFKPDGSFVHAFGWGVDTGASVLQTCTTASTCQAGITPTPNIDPPGECRLWSNNSPVAVGPAGNVFVADTSGAEPNFTARVQEFSAAGACVGETVLAVGNRRTTSLAVDGAKDAYVADEKDLLQLRKYDLGVPPSQPPLCDLDPGIETTALAFDEVGHLFAAQRELADKAGGVHRVITEYDVSSCPPTKHVRRFGYRKIDSNMNGLAALHTAQGDVFGSETSGVNYLSIPPPGPLVARIEPPLSIGNVRVKVRAEVNPEGKASQAEFEYVDDASYQEDIGNGGDGFEGPGTKVFTKAVPTAKGIFRANATEALLGCEVPSQEAIDNGECLTPGTLYHWRVSASNADGDGEGPLVGLDFETAPPVQMEVFATAVSSDTATLNARVNPLGIPTTGFFEYVDDAAYQQDIGNGGDGFAAAAKVPNVDAEPPEAEYDFGEGEAPLKRSATLSALSLGTTYHYRLSAQNAFFTGLHSEEKTFITFKPAQVDPSCANEEFRFGAGALLPDCRAYEMVSPLDKEGGDILALRETTTVRPVWLQQAAISGDRLAYGSYRAFGDAKSASFASQYIANREQDGWQSHGIDPPNGQSLQNGVEEIDSEFRAFSDDLCEAWVGPLYDPPLAAGAIAGFRNYYRRNDQLCGGESYEALTTAKPQDVGSLIYKLELQGVSADGEIVAFGATDGLEGTTAPPSPGVKLPQLYVKGPGSGPVYACILPGGTPSPEECSAGTNSIPFATNRLGNMTNALSEDGTLLYWTNAATTGEIYLRENPVSEEVECAVSPTAPCTVPVSEAGEALSGTSSSQFWAAAADGSAAIYTTGSLGAGAADLYRYTAADEGTQLIAADVFGFMGASEEAERIYFASGEEIAGSGQNSEGAEAVGGEPNLYLYEVGADSYRFVARLADEDVEMFPAGRQSSSATALEPVKRGSRVAADGLSAAFMSAAPITGYDNTDAASAAPCGESGGICDTGVFIYEADSEELLCASCNPSGARPMGTNANGGDFGAAPFWVAGRLVVWETTLRAPRVMDENGDRLFFESQDALVARDTNGRFDVYQWERAGRGGCKASGASFSAQNGGCIDLISSGQSLRDSLFVDSSPEGDDVFFNTLAGLVPQDYGLVDIYDARVGGGLPSPPPPPVECEGESCQSPAPAPEFQVPGSVQNVGPGNLAPQGAKPRQCPKGKHPTKVKGKKRCVKNKKSKRPRR